MSYTFKPLKIGGGGYNTGIDISPDGLTMAIRTDTYGSYVWNTSTLKWDQTILEGKWPAGFLGGGGIWEIRVAPSNSAILYQMYSGFMFKSTDRGATWTQLTNFARQSSNENAFPTKLSGPKMGVSPTDANVVYVGTETGGVWFTSNGGTTWAQVTSIPVASAGYISSHTVNFDPASTKVYISSPGNGMYKAASAGSSFSSISGGPGTTNPFYSVKMATDGILYATTGNPVGGGTNPLWKYVDGSPGTWTDVSPGVVRLGTVVCDPNNSARVVVGDTGGKLYFSSNRGAGGSWSSLILTTRTATDVPWLQTTAEGYMSEGNMIFDPLVANRIWLAEGIGTWYADVGSTTPVSGTVDWQSRNNGIEQLVANCVVSTPNNDLVVASWDRGIFRMDRAAKDTYRSNQQYDTTTSINDCWHIDYATSSPSFLVAVMDAANGGTKRSSKSTDGGATWSEFSAYPSDTSGLSPWIGGYGGTSAVSTPLNWIWSPQVNQDLWQTKDGGSTWTRVAITGVPVASGTTTVTGWGERSFFGGDRHIATAADRVTLNKFYAYNQGASGDASFAGLYKSVDSGDTWTRVYSGVIDSYEFDRFGSTLKSVPKLGTANTAGHLFFTCGFVGGTQPQTSAFFKRWTDTSATWTTITNVAEVIAFGFGACAPGKDYPTVYISGYVNPGSGYDYGLWQGIGNSSDWDSNTQTWTKLTTNPFGWADSIVTVDGDKSTFGTSYFGFGGSGYAYGSLDTIAPAGPSLHRMKIHLH